jgi:hypothetical protein
MRCCSLQLEINSTRDVWKFCSEAVLDELITTSQAIC